MDELLYKINETINSVTTQDLERMTSTERREYLELLEKLEARMEVLKEKMEGVEE